VRRDRPLPLAPEAFYQNKNNHEMKMVKQKK
jgi:hypothetical protein